MPASDSNPSSAPERGGDFPTTRDSLITQLTGGDAEVARQAVSSLCVMYREPILHWLVKRGEDPDKAEDLVQGFMAFLLEENRFGHFARGRVKFRSFLLECLKRYRRGEWRRGQAAKRGGG